MATGPQVAVIGGGVSGLTAAYLLSRAGRHVTLLETDARLGGQADTHMVPGAGGRMLAVDTGFIVFNERTYPLLTRLFAELGVHSQPSQMSMSVSCAGCGLGYAGGNGALGERWPGCATAAAGTCACSPRFRGSTAARGPCWLLAAA
ncbi:MAG: FAD-dependent oxidoreductase, partial [Trebonia sp.]